MATQHLLCPRHLDHWCARLWHNDLPHGVVGVPDSGCERHLHIARQSRARHTAGQSRTRHTSPAVTNKTHSTAAENNTHITPITLLLCIARTTTRACTSAPKHIAARHAPQPIATTNAPQLIATTNAPQLIATTKASQLQVTPPLLDNKPRTLSTLSMVTFVPTTMGMFADGADSDSGGMTLVHANWFGVVAALMMYKLDTHTTQRGFMQSASGTAVVRLWHRLTHTYR